ncbi:MAG: hypothetical protein ACOX19_04705 [Fermentimonas sp.]
MWTKRKADSLTGCLFFKVSLFWLGLLSFTSCTNELPRQTIPYAPVNIQIDLNGLDHELRNPLAYKVFTEKGRRTDVERFGYSGVLVTSNADGTAMYAYDLCCPHEKKREVRVVPEDNGTATCSTCGTVFVTLYGLGTPEKGPSTQPLQCYRVISIAPGMYRVVN